MNARNAEEDFGVELLDADTLLITWSNDYHLLLPGMPAGLSLVGHRMCEFIPFCEAMRIEDALRRVARTGEPHAEEMRVMGGPGRPGYVWRWWVYRPRPGELLVVYQLQ